MKRNVKENGNGETAYARGLVLIVDDHADLAENLAEILAGAGFETVTAPSAEAGLARIEAGGIMALVTDYRLPAMNGAQLIAEIRQRGSRIPAIVMSAFTDDQTIGHARAAGAAEVLSKPVDLDRLMKRVTELTNGKPLVLLVDDNRDLAEDLAEILRHHGHAVTTCGTIAEARALGAAPTAAVLDFRLPDGTGLEVAKSLLARDPRTRILFLSGYPADLVAGLGSEPAVTSQAAHLQKPVDIERLLSWVAEALERGTAAGPRR